MRSEAETPGEAEGCDPCMRDAVDSFCEAMRIERNASVHTVRAYRTDLLDYARWAKRRHLDALAVTHRQLRRYLGELRPSAIFAHDYQPPPFRFA